MQTPVTLIGSYLSPYVRKVLALLHLKGVPYVIDPIAGFFGNDEFTRISPVRRIPVLMDGDLTLCDSSVICQYLEDRHPSPALYPRGLADRARSRWLEEYADTRMGEVIIWRLFNQRVIAPYLWGEKTDQAIVDHAINHDIPQILDYLETQIPPSGFIFGELSIADISIACFFRNAALTRYSIDPLRWPRTAALVDTVLGLEAFTRVRAYEDTMRRTPVPQQREALIRMGAPISAKTYGADKPRRGILQI